MKGQVDGFFGVLEKRAAMAAKGMLIDSCQKIHDTFKETAGKDEIHMLFVPKESRHSFIQRHVPISRGSLPRPIRSTHMFSFKHLDTRRSDPGRSLIANDKRTITGIKAHQ